MKLYSFVGLVFLVGLVAWANSSGSNSGEQCGWACQNARASEEDLKNMQAADNARRNRDAKASCESKYGSNSNSCR